MSSYISLNQIIWCAEFFHQMIKMDNYQLDVPKQISDHNQSIIVFRNCGFHNKFRNVLPDTCNEDDPFYTFFSHYQIQHQHTDHQV